MIFASHYLWGCRIIRGSYYIFPHMINWTLLLLNIERVFVVMFPLHAKKWFSVRKNKYYIVVVFVFALLLAIVGGWQANVYPSPPSGAPQCTSDTLNVPLWISFTIVLWIDIYTVPNLVSLLCALFIMFKVHRELTKRNALIHNHLRQADPTLAQEEGKSTKSKIALSQLTGALVAAIMAFVRAFFSFPGLAFSVFFYYGSFSDVTAAAKAIMIFYIFEVFACLSNLSDFIIYIVRIPAFRATLFCRPITQSSTYISEKSEK